MNIEKIRVSQFAPESTDLAWYNPQTKELRIFSNGEWTLVAGGGGGGGGNLLVGTKEDREALTPYNGLEFNQVDEDGTVHRYLYEENEWVLLLNPEAHDSEEVIFNINSNNGGVILSNLKVIVENTTTGVSHEVEIDSAGEGIIYIPIGHIYKITMPTVDDYVLEQYEFTYTAERYIRTINATYLYSGSYDVLARYFILEKDGLPSLDYGGSEAVMTRILEGRVDSSKPYGGTYVIDEVHKKYAKLDVNNHALFADGTAYAGTYGNVFRYFPKLYIYKDASYTGSGTKYYVGDTNFTGAVSPETLPEAWIGVYKAHYGSTTGCIYSRPRLSTTGNVTIANFQSYAKNNGSNYGINDYKGWQTLCALFLAKFGTTNVEDTPAGGGLALSESREYFNINTGVTESIGDATGKVLYTGSYYQCKLFGIEAPWGQQWEFLKGIRFNGATATVYNANSWTTSEPAERTFTRTQNLSSAYITQMVLGNHFDMIPYAAGAGTSATYYCDAGWSGNGQNLLPVGGASDAGARAGLFSSASAADFASSAAAHGARLCFYGDISQYELVTGAALAALNS